MALILIYSFKNLRILDEIIELLGWESISLTSHYWKAIDFKALSIIDLAILT
jgi:hypothetical protein